MTRVASFSALALGILLMACASPAPLTKSEGEALDPLMGDWVGYDVMTTGAVAPLAVQVIPLGEGSYEALTLPTAGGGGRFRMSFKFQYTEGRLSFPEEPDWRVSLAGGKLAGVITGEPEGGTIELSRSVHLSPTLGARAPEGAIVLFDGATLAAWNQVKGSEGKPPTLAENVAWKLEGDAMEVVAGTGSIVTKRKFSDFFMHLEFRTPFMPAARGQARGNSGVYLQGRYEIQVLDSYGLTGEDNECGGIYKVARPRVNMCAPPGQWQTYDIEFHAPLFDSAGTRVKEAWVTVLHNGVLIHEDLSIPAPTGGALDNDLRAPGGIYLQDHGNPVQYRNIWVKEIPR